MRRACRLLALVLLGGPQLAVPGSGEADGGAPDPVPVREAWLPDTDEIVYWHWQKDRYGPALTGSASWRHFMGFVEERLRRAGVVDLERNGWRFRRWTTSLWPDDSRWSLAVAGDPVAVASFGANSGSTPPEGLTAPLTLYEEGDPPESLAGRIAVLRTRVDADVVRRLAETDYEYRAPFGVYPWPEESRSGDRSHREESRSPDPAEDPERQVPTDVDSASWHIFPQLMQTRELIATARAGGAAGAVLVFDAGRELAAGLYTFPVPALHDMPTVMVDRNAGAGVVRAARARESATLRLEAEVVSSEAYQLVGFLPGRDYGTPDDEVIQLVTHTDGPAISQDNGALGVLGLVRYFARVPQQRRARTLMVVLDCRHFMPGQEQAFAGEDYFARHPDARDPIVAVLGMEHLGQIEYEEHGDRLVASGRVDPSLIWTTDDPALTDLAIRAVKHNGLRSATVRNVTRPGVHGRDQGLWYGMASPERIGGLPAVAIMGSMGGYWGTAADIRRLDPTLFRRQVATFVQVTAGLMSYELADTTP